MKIPKLFKAVLLVFGTPLVLFFAVLSITPFILDSDTIRIKVVEQLSSWSGGKFRVQGPLKLKYFPSISLTAKQIEIANLKPLPALHKISAKQLKVNLSLWALLFGKVEIDMLKLSTPNIIVQAEHSKDNNLEQYLSNLPLLDVLKQIPINTLVINHGIVRMTLPDSTQHTYRDFFAVWDFSDHMQKVRGEGSFVWRKEQTSYTFEAASNTTTPASEATHELPTKAFVSFDLDYEISNSLFQKEFSGKADYNQKLSLVGKADFKVHDIKSFSKWLHADFALNETWNEITSFAAAGHMSWQTPYITFVNSRFAFDRTLAEGTLALDYGETRAKLEGTLALEHLNLSASSKHLSPQVTYEKIRKSATALQQMFDADLRISSDRLTLGNLQAGRSALTLSLKSNLLLADVAELQMCEGGVSGQLQISMKDNHPQLELDVAFKDVELGRCVQVVTGQTFIESKGQAKVSVTAFAKEYDAFVSSLKGTISVKAETPGVMSLALEPLFDMPTPTVLKGWDDRLKGQTEFKTFSADMTVQDGIGRIQNVILKNGRAAYFGQGVLDFAAQHIDYELAQRKSSLQDASLNVSDLPRATVTIQGPWQAPQITVQSP